MTDRYARIRQALAMGPTPGPWAINTAGVGVNGKIVVNEIYVYNPEVADDVAIAADIIDPETGEPSEANARLIAACDPDTIRALLAERDELAKDAARYRWLRSRWGRIADTYDGDSDRLVEIREADDRFEGWDVSPESLDAAIDAAIAAGSPLREGGE